MKFGVELFSYNRKVIGEDGKAIQLLPTNMVIGGPSQGEILYAPIIYMADGMVHVKKDILMWIRQIQNSENYDRIKTGITTM